MNILGKLKKTKSNFKANWVSKNKNNSQSIEKLYKNTNKQSIQKLDYYIYIQCNNYTTKFVIPILS